MKFLYLIPARGGSKGIPGKNIKLLANKPLIYYSIDMAREMASDDDICVSTDSDQIIKAVEDYGLKVAFKRPDYLASDQATTHDTILHALEYYESKGIYYDAVVLLQATSPFRKKSDIQEAIKLYSPDIDMLASVKITKANPYYVLFEENKEGFLEKVKSGEFTRRQDCPPVYEYNGSVFIMNTGSLKRESNTNFKKVRKYLMEDLYSIDLDEMIDWYFAEFLLEKGLIDLS